MNEIAADDLRRRLTTFASLNLLIFTLILVSNASNRNDIFVGFILGFGLLLIFYGITVIIGFYQRRDNYDVRLGNLEQFISVIFLVIGVIQTIVGFLATELFLSTQGILLILLGNSSRRRQESLKNPQFIQWYNQENNSDLNLRQEEVYASCPHCSSLLAVIPSLLGPEDRCPNCDGLLVNLKEEE